MSWSIEIPHFGDRDDLVLETIRAARQQGMREDQQRVVEVLANDALGRGVTTVGGLLDELQDLSQDECRQRLDSAREKAGLVSATESDRRREDAHFDAAWDRLQPPDPERWSPLQRCPECGRYPTKDGDDGAWMEVDCEQWHCPEHRAGHEADMQPHTPAVVGLSAGGAPIYSEREQRRRAEWVRQRQEREEREREQREEFQRREGEAIEEAKRRFADQGEISVLGVRTRPDLRIIEK
jgi:hypothetical protein